MAPTRMMRFQATEQKHDFQNAVSQERVKFFRSVKSAGIGSSSKDPENQICDSSEINN